MHDDRVHHTEGPKGKSVGPHYALFAQGYGDAAAHVPIISNLSLTLQASSLKWTDALKVRSPTRALQASIRFQHRTPTTDMVRISIPNIQTSHFECVVVFDQSWC